MGREDDEKVGYGRPPRSGQFQKGKSGNPNGRPRKSESATVSTAMARVLKQVVTGTIEGRRKRMTIGEAAVLQLVEKASRGSLGALRDIIKAQRELEREEAASGGGGWKITGSEYPTWLRSFSSASDVVELLTFLDVLIPTENGEFHIDRTTMLDLVDKAGLEVGDHPLLSSVPISTRELEGGGKIWRRDESLFDEYARLMENSVALEKEASGKD